MNIDRLQLLAAAHGAPTHGQPGVAGSAPANYSQELVKTPSLQIQVQPCPSRSKKALLGALLLLAALPLTAAVDTWYWDANGSDYGAGDPPTGDWGAIDQTATWTLDYYGTSPTFGYSNRANVIFAAAGDAYWSDTADYTVSAMGTTSVSDMVFKDGNCTLTNTAGYLDKDSPFICVLIDGQTATINSTIASAEGTANGITKCAFGRLVLGATNTYVGPTTIEGGTLLLAAPQVLPPASTLVLAGGDNRTDLSYVSGYTTTDPKFGTGGYSQTLGPLLLTGPNTSLNYTIDFGHGASALVFADSHAQDWSGITLHLANYKRGVDSLRFGTSSAGLTSAQLGLLEFDFIDSEDAVVAVPAKIDSAGFVTPAPPVILSLTRSGSSSAVVTWSAIDGRRYLAQYKSNLNDASWSETLVTAATNTASFTNNAGANASGFYRIKLLPIQPPN